MCIAQNVQYVKGKSQPDSFLFSLAAMVTAPCMLSTVTIPLNPAKSKTVFSPA